MKFRMVSLAAATLFSLFTLTAQAKDQPAENVLTAENKTQFETQAASIRSQIKQGGRYEFVTDAERETINRQLAVMERLLSAHSDGSAFRENEKLELLNAQEQVNAILAQRDGKRLICTRRAPTGSNRPQSTCMTYADKERERRDTVNSLQESRGRTQMQRGN
ncbi:hypothetical protein [Tahibacter amnicola]|uniref:Uncharacterized protein n=1 Tax=Tahibacter amnicola TaxID=2976241 RepID=A0ABY6BHE3_9GAMM|nr:hypothetical protein [Tahibacter amnicola]UXI69270.1 hypothetical protein N4264_06370 [Tahibacter amnicola]